jgi:hypothetical protein
MGSNVNLYAVGDISDEHITTANLYLEHRIPADTVDGTDYDRFQRMGDERVEFATLGRYYGVGYERGPWPQIYAAIRCMQTAFPDAQVFYGDDTGGDCQPVTDELLTKIWDHFLGPNGDANRRR